MVNSKRKGMDWENVVYNTLLKLGYSVKKPLGSGGGVEPGDIVLSLQYRCKGINCHICGGKGTCGSGLKTVVFCLECKRYRRISMGQKKAFWDNHRFKVQHYNSGWVPVLVVKLDRHRPEVLLGDGHGGMLQLGKDSSFDDFKRYLEEIEG